MKFALMADHTFSAQEQTERQSVLSKKRKYDAARRSPYKKPAGNPNKHQRGFSTEGTEAGKGFAKRRLSCQLSAGPVQPTIVRDLQTAWNWVQSHKDMFIEEVTEPAFLRMSSNEQEDALKKVLGGHFPEDRYNFLFVFQPFKDMETFLSTCVDEYGLRVNAMVKKE